ncbi:EVE domain-containing protein [uncultured Amphritea sp.]|uniref:EVE domain-containing protein n=1 Tax=uncultured Amphritea sp. TaxID=981605 RepID=UPI0026145646|nr:EVE domain-containing protein [uncultured Amphritea sp.]
MKHNWIAVASADHVRIGKSAGFMQVCHGKAAPLRRIRPGDTVVYYSPTERLGDKVKRQAFTAIGVVKPAAPYQVDMGAGFQPFRRDVCWFDAREVSILPLLDQLEFSAGNKNWGYRFRFGLFQVSDHDMQMISSAMI